jgi:hypothetical protein
MRRGVPRWWLLALALLLPAAATPTSRAEPSGTPGVTVSVVGSLTNARPTVPVTTGTHTAALTAARNEFESFQVVVQAGATPVTGMSVFLSEPLSGPGGTIPAANVTIYREGYYTVTRPSDGELWTTDPCPSDCRLPDALIPERDTFFQQDRNAFPVNVAANTNQTAWVDVLVPHGQVPGIYAGRLTVSSAAGTEAVIDVAVTVVGFQLPSTSTLHGTFSMNPNKICPAHDACVREAAGGWPIYERYVRAALDNRITITNPGLLAPTPGNLANFRTYAEPALQGTAPTRLPGARLTDVVLNLFEKDAMASWKTEGAAAGFLPRLSFYCDETAQSPTLWQDLCNTPYLTAKANWDATAVSPDPGPLPVAKIGTKADLDWARGQGYAVATAINTLIPIVNFLHPKGQPSTRPSYDAFLAESPRNRVWMYTSCMSSGCTLDYTPDPLWSGWPSNHIDQIESEQRALGWQDFIYRVSGDYYFEAVIDLPKAWNTCAGSPPANCQYNEGANGDGTLFYPGTPATIGGTTDIPVESIRLRRIRDGREDFEYLHCASTHGRDADARAIAGGLFPTLGQSNVSQASFDAARQQLIALVAQIPSCGRIAFTSDRDGNNEIYVMSDDGSGTATQLTFTGAPTSNSQPGWSPDGTRIVFRSNRDGNDEIYVVNANGGAAQRLTATANTVSDSKPVVSPDGERIAFVRNSGGKDDIYVMRADGSNVTPLVTDVDDDYDPAWSPNGNQLVFSSRRAGSNGADLYVVNSDGTYPASSRITSANGEDDGAAWRGAYVAFDRANPDYEVLFKQPSAAAAETNVTQSPSTHDYFPSWSPAGDQLAFVQGVGVSAELYRAAAAAAQTPVRLTTNASSDTEPDWSPPLLASPYNNAFADALNLRGLPAPLVNAVPHVGLQGLTIGATKEAGEPGMIAGNAGGASVWLSWKAPSNAHMIVDLSGSTYDTLLGVFQGSSLATLALVAANDDDDAGKTSRVSFNAVSGVTYSFLVDGHDGATGVYHFDLQAAPPTAVRLSRVRAKRLSGP